MSKTKLTPEEIAERKAASLARKEAMKAAAPDDAVLQAALAPKTRAVEEEPALSIADEIELEQLLVAAEAASDPPPVRPRRMSGDEVAGMLRQQRRERRLAEKGY